MKPWRPSRPVAGAGFAALLLLTCWCTTGSRPKPVRVLFIGNSYTFVNDLPGMLARLAKAGGHALETGQECPGGLSLKGHVAGGRAQAAIAGSRWDWIVLQEQSQAPSFPHALVERDMYPAVRALDSQSRTHGARTLLYLTWGHRDGDRDNRPQDTYEAMQARLDESYGAIARELHAAVAPVGPAWQLAHASRPALALWDADGSHPSVAGTYLAACVFYQVLFQRPALGSPYQATLDLDTARFLQSVARDATATYTP